MPGRSFVLALRVVCTGPLCGFVLTRGMMLPGYLPTGASQRSCAPSLSLSPASPPPSPFRTASAEQKDARARGGRLRRRGWEEEDEGGRSGGKTRERAPSAAESNPFGKGN
eukprot:1209532-Rhodomonas_salina.1